MNRITAAFELACFHAWRSATNLSLREKFILSFTIIGLWAASLTLFLWSVQTHNGFAVIWAWLMAPISMTCMIFLVFLDFPDLHEMSEEETLGYQAMLSRQDRC